jgi:hypothetical protein
LRRFFTTPFQECPSWMVDHRLAKAAGGMSG